MKISFDHCVVHVSDWRASNTFYREVVGAVVVPRGEGLMYRFGVRDEGVSVYFRDPDGSLLEFNTYGGAH